MNVYFSHIRKLKKGRQILFPGSLKRFPSAPDNSNTSINNCQEIGILKKRKKKDIKEKMMSSNTNASSHLHTGPRIILVLPLREQEVVELWNHRTEFKNHYTKYRLVLVLEILSVKTTKKAILTNYFRVLLVIKQQYLKSKYFIDVIENSFLFDFQITTCF